MVVPYRVVIPLTAIIMITCLCRQAKTSYKLEIPSKPKTAIDHHISSLSCGHTPFLHFSS